MSGRKVPELGPGSQQSSGDEKPSGACMQATGDHLKSPAIPEEQQQSDGLPDEHKATNNRQTKAPREKSKFSIFKFGRKKSTASEKSMGSSDAGQERKQTRDGSLDSEYECINSPKVPATFQKRDTKAVADEFKRFFDRANSPAAAEVDSEMAEKAWIPPESWAVMPPPMEGFTSSEPRTGTSDPKDNYAIRVFKPFPKSKSTSIPFLENGGHTFVTVSCSLETTTAELCGLLARKFYACDTSRYRLYVVRSGTERMLAKTDKPLLLQKKWLEEIGYNESDQLAKLGREDHSYLCRFIFREFPINNLPVSHLLEQAEPDAHRARVTERTANLVGENLSVIPVVMFKNAATLESIDLSRNAMLTLPDDFAQQLTSLRLLRLRENLLNTIPPSALIITTLSHLDLSCNYLTGDVLGPLAALSRLTHLNLECNLIKTLPQTFNAFNHMRVLNLSSNYLEELPSVVLSMPEMKELDLAFNLLTEIPNDLVKLALLKTLILTGNALQSLPPALSELTRLKLLDVRANLISDLGNAMHAPAIIELHADYNQISAFRSPKCDHIGTMALSKNPLTDFDLTGMLFGLTELDLTSCKLANLPDEIMDHTPLLVSIKLDKNQLQTIPSSVNRLSFLQRLSINSNHLSELQLAFQDLPKLEYLSAHGNNLKLLPSELYLAPSLKILNLSSNLLSALPSLPPGLDVLPLVSSLQELYLGENRCRDDIADSLQSLSGLRILNLSMNEIYGLGDSIKHMGNLEELYLSDNHMTSIPDEIDRLRSLRVLYVNGNKLSNLPAELGKNLQLAVLDASSNNLKYNISNWPYDWNWNWNLELQYLNLSNNRRLEIKPMSGQPSSSEERCLTDFGALTKLRILNVSDVNIAPTCIPAETLSMCVRTSSSEGDHSYYGLAESCGRDITFDMSDFILPRFMDRDKDCLIGLFDGCGEAEVSQYLNDMLPAAIISELTRTGQGCSIPDALRRAFLYANKEFSNQPVLVKCGSTAAIAYLTEGRLYVANVGDTMVVVSRNGEAVKMSTKHHPWLRSEIGRIRSLGGFISREGLVEGQIPITRAFGYFHLLPYVNANPSIKSIELNEEDEFLVIANHGLWKYISYQVAVDIARHDKADYTIAAQKLRDMALSYGATENICVMVVGIRELLSKRPSDGDISRIDRRRPRNKVLDRNLARLPEPEAPIGQVAIAFTDIKDSTVLWDTYPAPMRVANRIHNNIMRRQLRNFDGYEFKTEGDAFMVAFPSVCKAIRWCCTVQQLLLEAEWPPEIINSPICAPVYGADGELLFCGLTVRMGVHYGSPICEMDVITERMDYMGSSVIIASRICNAALGGQIFVSEVVHKTYEGLPSSEKQFAADPQFFDHGMIKLKGFENLEHVYAVYNKTLEGRKPILDAQPPSTK